MIKFRKTILKKIIKLFNSDEEIIGVDIAKDGVKIVQLKKQGTVFALEKIHSIELNSYDIDSEAQYKYAIIDAIKSIVDRYKISTKNASLAISSGNSILKVVSIPILSDKELKNAIEYDSLWDNLIQLPEDSAEYSIYHSVISKNQNTNMMNLLVVASKYSDLEKITTIASRAKLEPMIIDVDVLIIKHVIDLIPSSGTKIVLHIGDNSSYIAIYKGITPHITDIFISDDDWESIKNQDNHINILKRISIQVQQVINNYIAEYEDVVIDSIYSITNTSINYDYSSIINDNINLDCDIKELNPFENIIIPKNLQEKVDLIECKSSWTTVIGLAMKEMNIIKYYQKTTGVQGVNLLPNIGKLKAKKQLKIFSKIVFILSALIFAFFAFVVHQDTTTTQAKLDLELNKLNNVKNELAQKNAIIKELSQKKEDFNLLLNSGLQLTSNKEVLFNVIKHISNSIPDGVGFKSINLKNNNLYISGKSINDQNILSTIDNIKKSKLINKVSLVSMSIDDKKNKDFQLLIKFKGNK
jgi:type IV pilus assembly protein PilN